MSEEKSLDQVFEEMLQKVWEAAGGAYLTTHFQIEMHGQFKRLFSAWINEKSPHSVSSGSLVCVDSLFGIQIRESDILPPDTAALVDCRP